MAIPASVLNVRLWIVSGFILAFLIGSWGESTGTILMVILLVQMCFSMDGIRFDRNMMKTERKPILTSLLMTYGFSSGVAILCGLAFLLMGYKEVWIGWVMIAAVPCAVSVITVAMYLKGDVSMSVLALSVVYLFALVWSPVLTFIFAGDSINPIEILKYILLFVLIPILISYPMKKLNLKREPKVLIINCMMLCMIMFSVGYDRDYILSDIPLVLMIVAACIVRMFVFGNLLFYLLRKFNVPRRETVTYMPMAVWKNTSLATTFCLILIPELTGAVMPCVVCLLMETVWFIYFSSKMEKSWPAEN